MSINVEIEKNGGTKEIYKKVSYFDLKLFCLALVKGEIKQFTATQKE